MRWDEISLNEFTRPPDMDEADAVLIRAGYKHLGSGAYANVYHKQGKPYVLKVFTVFDTAYLAYVNLVQQHPNIHFPKFYGKLIRVTPKYYAIRTEYLDKYDEIADKDRSVAVIGRYLFYCAQPPRKQDQQEKFDVATQWMEERPSLKEACDLIAKNLLPKFNEDIHRNNVMMRGDTIVLTDPVS
jgi:hypothetical protein